MSEVVNRRLLIFGAVFLVVFSSMHAALGNNIQSNKTKTADTVSFEHFTDCVIIMFGKCNEVTGPILWKLGVYCNLLKRDFTINAKGEFGETINLIIRGSDNFKFLWGKENIKIDLRGATGILFWGDKSIIADNTIIILRCKVKNVYLTEYQ
jgi:hypothetical protein